MKRKQLKAWVSLFVSETSDTGVSATLGYYKPLNTLGWKRMIRDHPNCQVMFDCRGVD